MTKAASSFVTDVAGDKEAAEMDSLLSGFERHKKFDYVNEGATIHLKKSTSLSLDRVESEEAEIASLTQAPFQMPNLWFPQSGAPKGKSSSQVSLACSDCDSSQLSRGDDKPMPSITLNFRRKEDASSPCMTSPSFLPRPLPMAENKSRSLFNSSNSQDPSLERILRADAIADAARSNEPLTDDDSDIDGDDTGFLLCLPQALCKKPPNATDTCHAQKKNAPKSSLMIRAESPLFNMCSDSPLVSKSKSGGFMRRKCSGHSLHGLSSPTAPTIYEEGSETLYESTLTTPFHPLPSHADSCFNHFDNRIPSDATFTTFCSLSDCDASDALGNHAHPPSKNLGTIKGRPSMGSLMSASSLCGLDIVHETFSNEATDQVPVLLPSGSSEFGANLFKPMSMNSLGLSVDSAEAGGDQRDLFTPVAIAAASSKQLLSPPPLRHRPASPFDAYRG
jgi:hypothetical protein